MGLSTIKKRIKPAPQRPNLVVDLSGHIDLQPGEDGKIRFREPQAPDFFVHRERFDKLRVNHPGFSPQLSGQIVMLASCYVPDKSDEGGEDLDLMFAEIAIGQRDLFLFLVRKFEESFPAAANFEKAVDSAGNVSKQ